MTLEIVLTNSQYCYIVIIVMEMTISVTNNWQLHLPKTIRELLGMEKPGLVKAKVERGKLIIAPKKSGLLALGGSLQHLYRKKPIDIDNIRGKIDYSQV